MSQRIPILKVNVPILMHARTVYTEAILDMFQDEYEKSLLVVIDQCIKIGATRPTGLLYWFAFRTNDCGCAISEWSGVVCYFRVVWCGLLLRFAISVADCFFATAVDGACLLGVVLFLVQSSQYGAAVDGALLCQR
ncbi:hypothetical protein U1Q18_029512 [Sarracenia purpurea var. burkii]